MHSVSNDGIGYKYLENYFWASEIKIAMKRNTTNCVMLEKFQLQRRRIIKQNGMAVYMKNSLKFKHGLVQLMVDFTHLEQKWMKQ